MSSLHLVDPELLPLLQDVQPPELTLATLPGARTAFDAQMPPEPGLHAQDVAVRAQMVPGDSDAPPLRVLIYRPAAANGRLPGILHIHGGGYVLGSPEMNDVSNRELAAELGCTIVSVDYRLAPEARHPAPVEDCYRALRWMHANAAALQLDAARIGIKGESAGGGLAAALALLARDRGECPVAFQHLIYPMLDDRTCVDPDPSGLAGEFVWTRATNLFGWSCLLDAAPGSPGVSPYAAAARAGDLAGLPPCFIATGALDLFLDENLDYARRLIRAGVPVELHVYPGAVHGFQQQTETRVTKAAERDSRDALRKCLHG